MSAIRVVLADDHTVMRSGLRVLLERHGFQVVGEAADGRQAVEAVDREKPDVVVMDVAMPALNGIEAARQITMRHADTAVVVLSIRRRARL